MRKLGQRRRGEETASCTGWRGWCQVSLNWPRSSYPFSESLGPPPMAPDGTWTLEGEGTTDVVGIVVVVGKSSKMWMYLG